MEAVIKELEALASDMVMEALNGDATDKAEKAFKARLRTALQCSDCAAKQGVPYAVLAREIGESSFFEHRPVKPGSDEHRFAIQDPHFDYIEVYTHPTQQGLDAQTQAARSVLAERTRQISAEGYTPEQDDGYNPGVLALHGGLYACHAFDNLAKKRAPEGWQWDAKWWKSKDPRSNLVKAGALILAEIERIDRAALAAQAKQGGV